MDDAARARALLAWAQEDPMKRAGDAMGKLGELDKADPVVLEVGESLAMMDSAARYLLTHPERG
jgi:hypothetical protein